MIDVASTHGRFWTQATVPSDQDMRPNENHRDRRSLRLREYDYAQDGAYFLTLCTRNREKTFGTIRDGQVVLAELGQIVRQCWSEIPLHFPDVIVDAHVVMPNHIHGIVLISKTEVRSESPSPEVEHDVTLSQQETEGPLNLRRPSGTARTIGSVVRGFKIGVSKRAKTELGKDGVWQRNYFERIIRGEHALRKARTYIANNPLRWQYDHENPERIDA